MFDLFDSISRKIENKLFRSSILKKWSEYAWDYWKIKKRNCIDARIDVVIQFSPRARYVQRFLTERVDVCATIKITEESKGISKRIFFVGWAISINPNKYESNTWNIRSTADPIYNSSNVHDDPCHEFTYTVTATIFDALSFAKRSDNRRITRWNVSLANYRPLHLKINGTAGV